MAELTISLIAVAALLVKGGAILGLSYLGARLAIRHERQVRNG